MSAVSLCHPALLGCVSPFSQPAASKLTVRLAVPSGGAAALINDVVGTAVDRALPAVNGAADARYAVEVIDVPQPAPAPGQTAPPLSSTLGPPLTSATPPDLLLFTQVVNVGVVPSQFALYARGTSGLHPLDDHLRGRRDLPLNDFHAPALEVCRNRGKLLGVPLMAAPLLLTYDARRFEMAGIPHPPVGWDWRRLADAARRLTRDTDGDGAVDEYGFWSGFSTATLAALIWQNGGNVLSPDRKSVLLDQPAALEAIEFYADFYLNEVVPPLVATVRAPVGPQGMRYEGRWWLGMTYQPEWLYPSAPSLAVAELPQGKQKAALLAVPAILSVSGKAKDPPLAASALAAIAGRVSLVVAPPARRLTAAAITSADSRIAPPLAEALVSGLAASRSLLLDDIQQTNALWTALNRQLVPPLQRRAQTPREAASATATTVQRLLDQS